MGWLPLRFVVIKKIFYAQTENSSKTDWISNLERDCQYSTLKHEEIKAMPKNIYSPNSPKKVESGALIYIKSVEQPWIGQILPSFREASKKVCYQRG